MVSSNRIRSLREGWRSIRVIFYAMLLGQVIFTLVVAYLSQIDVAPVPVLFGAGQDVVILGAYAGAMIAGAYFMDQFRTRHIPAAVLRQEVPAVRHYWTTVVIRLAILEAAVMLLLVTAMLTGNLSILLIATLTTAVFYGLFRPRLDQFAERYLVQPRMDG